MNKYFLISMNDEDVFINNMSLSDILKTYYPKISELENQKFTIMLENDNDMMANAFIQRQIKITRELEEEYEREGIPSHIMIRKEGSKLYEVSSKRRVTTNYNVELSYGSIYDEMATKYLLDSKYFKKIKNYFNKIPKEVKKNELSLDELLSILMSDKPSILLKENESQLFNMIPELKSTKGFDQKSKYHNLDLYEHILKVVDNTPKNIYLRLAALFHDVGKVQTMEVDEMGQGHFYGHWDVSKYAFNRFAILYDIEKNVKDFICKLIEYHDIDISKDNNQKIVASKFNNDELYMLLLLKRADLMAQDHRYNNIDKVEKAYVKMLKKDLK